VTLYVGKPPSSAFLGVGSVQGCGITAVRTAWRESALPSKRKYPCEFAMGFPAPCKRFPRGYAASVTSIDRKDASAFSRIRRSWSALPLRSTATNAFLPPWRSGPAFRSCIGLGRPVQTLLHSGVASAPILAVFKHRLALGGLVRSTAAAVHLFAMMNPANARQAACSDAPPARRKANAGDRAEPVFPF